jgi:hypothetical protein
VPGALTLLAQALKIEPQLQLAVLEEQKAAAGHICTLTYQEQ